MRHPSSQTRAVLGVLLQSPAVWMHGYDIVSELGLASGTVYPMLIRLHDRDVLETTWVESPIEGRPRRHLYRLTPGGLSWARDVTTEYANGLRTA